MAFLPFGVDLEQVVKLFLKLLDAAVGVLPLLKKSVNLLLVLLVVLEKRLVLSQLEFGLLRLFAGILDCLVVLMVFPLQRFPGFLCRDVIPQSEFQKFIFNGNVYRI